MTLDYSKLLKPTTMTGATGNKLYPAPKPVTSYPSVSAYAGKLTAPAAKPYPSVSDYAGKLTSAVSKPATGYPSLSAYAGKLTAPSGSSSSSASSWKMPAGFASAALGGSAPQPQQAPAAPPRVTQPAAAPVRSSTPAPGQGYGMSSPTTAGAVNKQAAVNNSQNQLMQKYGGPPKGAGVYATKEEAAYHAGAFTPDSTHGSSDLKYGSTTANGGGWRVGDAPSTPQQRPAQPAKPVVVGRPTQTGQPVSIPTNRPLTPEEVIELEQGGWLS